MIEQVIKRDGKAEAYNFNKISKAISSAFEACGKDVPKGLLEDVENTINTTFYKESMDIEDIQDFIISYLKSKHYRSVAKCYSEYREERDRVRIHSNALYKNMKKALDASDVQNQNANVDEKSFGGRIGELSRVATKQIALDDFVSEVARKNHLENRDYIHDLDSYAAGMHNCLSIPFDDLLAKGFNTRQTDVRPAGSVATAFQLVAVIFQLQSLQQFGGVSATHLDWTMVPYVRKSFKKHFLDGLLYVEGLTVDNNIYKEFENNNSTELNIENDRYRVHDKGYTYAMNMLQREIDQSAEALFHNLNTLQSRSGNQLPFTSINFGTCTLPEGRMVSKALLNISIKGLGKHHKTPIFPCSIFQYMKDVNDKSGTPNYDLKMLALRSTSQRLYPNYVNVDWSGNKGYDIKDPCTYMSTMGALAGHEHLYVKIGTDKPVDISIRDLYEFCKTGNLSNYKCTQIYYNKPETPKEVKQTFSKSGLPNVSGVYKVTYIPEDVTYIGSTKSISRRCAEHKTSIRHAGKLDSGMYFDDHNVDNYKFEILEVTEDYKSAEKKYIETVPNANPRGTYDRYYKTIGQVNKIYERPNFTQDTSYIQDLINLEDYDIKVYDLGGKWTKVRHIFKNDKHNTPLMLHIWYKEHDRDYCLSCTEDHPLWNGTNFVRADLYKVGDYIYRADGLKMQVTDITWHWTQVDSYDIGTETGTFVGSDIQMHNCRTANGWDINGLGQLKDGRGNICPCTVILPTLAMEAKEKNPEDVVNQFMKDLDHNLDEVKDMLLERFEWICSQSPDSAKFMYENGTMVGYVPEEGIRSALKHGTLAIGQLGLAETLQILIGEDHTTSRGMELAKRIEQLFKDKCAKYKNKYKLNFGVYYTPAENLCYTAMSKFKKKYGVIPNVSDRDYFTNSMHIPVWKDVDPFKKIDLESQLTGYSSAGCITYVELPATTKNNLEALEVLVDYAMEHDIPYFAVNVPNDKCLDCGYEDEITGKCPQCSSEHIERLRRVTGYLTGNYLTAFNPGKVKEAEDRVKHIKG